MLTTAGVLGLMAGDDGVSSIIVRSTFFSVASLLSDVPSATVSTAVAWLEISEASRSIISRFDTVEDKVESKLEDSSKVTSFMNHPSYQCLHHVVQPLSDSHQ